MTSLQLREVKAEVPEPSAASLGAPKSQSNLKHGQALLGLKYGSQSLAGNDIIFCEVLYVTTLHGKFYPRLKGLPRQEQHRD